MSFLLSIFVVIAYIVTPLAVFLILAGAIIYQSARVRVTVVKRRKILLYRKGDEYSLILLLLVFLFIAGGKLGLNSQKGISHDVKTRIMEKAQRCLDGLPRQYRLNTTTGVLEFDNHRLTVAEFVRACMTNIVVPILTKFRHSSEVLLSIE